jgi:RimJ/RimL family protein N-acetyltransferase
MPQPEHVLNTPNLLLEPLLPAHARLLFPALQDRRQYQFYAGQPPVNVEELEQRYKGWASRMSPDATQVWLNYAIRRTDGVYVGWVQATIAGNMATIGYDIFPDFWRQGYATEACGELVRALSHEHKVAKIVAVVDSENIASIRLLERLGFSMAWVGPSEDMPGRQDRRYELLV